MALDLYTNKDQKYGIAEQTVWGTAVADSGAVVELDCEPVQIVQATNIREGLGSHGTRNKIADDVNLDTHGSLPTFTIAGDARKDVLDFFLFGFFQNVTEGAVTPFKKTFTWPTTQPDFTLAGGIFFTFFDRSPITAQSWKVTDCIVQSLTISIDVGGMVKYSAECIGRGKIADSATPSGAWTRPNAAANTDFWYWAGTGSSSNQGISRLTIGGSAFVPTGAIEISLSQEVAPVGTGTTSGEACDSFVIKNRVGTWKCNAALSNISLFQGAHTGNTQPNVNIGWGNATAGNADGDLDFSFMTKITDVKKDNQDALGVEVAGEIVANSGAANAITVITANAIDRTW